MIKHIKVAEGEDVERGQMVGLVVNERGETVAVGMGPTRWYDGTPTARERAGLDVLREAIDAFFNRQQRDEGVRYETTDGPGLFDEAITTMLREREVAEGWRVPLLRDPARLAHLAVMRIREAQRVAALVGFLLTDETALTLPPCPHVYFTERMSAGLLGNRSLACRCLACGALVERG